MSIKDELSGRLFLVDSGADVSVFPVSLSASTMLTPRTVPSLSTSGSLVAANGSAIKTFGSARIALRFKTLSVVHTFLLADVPRPILGSDFFSAVGRLIGVQNRQLVRLPKLSAPLAVLPAVLDGAPRSVSGLHAPRANAV